MHCLSMVIVVVQGTYQHGSIECADIPDDVLRQSPQQEQSTSLKTIVRPHLFQSVDLDLLSCRSK